MRRVLCAALLTLVCAGCTAREVDEPYRPPALARATPLLMDGRDLYLRDCAWCHGPVGRGTDRAPDLVSGTNGPALVDFVLSTGRMPIDHPRDRVRSRDPIYTPEQIALIVEYSRALGAPGPEVPEVDPAAADIAHGNELYQENCAACHSTTGIGGALTQGRTGSGNVTSSFIAPSLMDSTAIQLAEAIRTGPGTMPVFAEENFDDHDVSAIVRYVLYLQDPEDRGGADAGRIGPVAEGAVGWIIGLGFLLVMARWIGTRRGEP